MPHVDGLQLCRTVRNDLAWSRLPIMFLSGTSEPGQIQAMFAAGADDHIAKPIVPEILVTRIVSRIERSRAINELSERDARTGLANVQGFTAKPAGCSTWPLVTVGRSTWPSSVQISRMGPVTRAWPTRSTSP